MDGGYKFAGATELVSGGLPLSITHDSTGNIVSSPFVFQAGILEDWNTGLG